MQHFACHRQHDVSVSYQVITSNSKILECTFICSIIGLTNMKIFFKHHLDIHFRDVTYCADVTLFLHATSGGLSLNAGFSLQRFLAFYCFKCYFVSVSSCKTTFLPSIMPLNTLYNAITPNNCFVKGSHKYDVYLVEENKAHLN